MPENSKNALPMTADYFRLIVRHFGRTPELTAEIIKGTGVDLASAESSEASEPILLEQQLQQIRNVSRIVGSDWALEIGPRFGTAAHGEFASAAASAPDLGAALQILERFAYIRAPYFQIHRADASSELMLEVRPRLRLDSATWISLVETLLLSIQSTVESALGRPIEEARFTMDFEAPTHAGRYADAFHAPVAFGAEHTCIRLPLSWCSLPCPYANATTHRRAVERLETAERNLLDPKFLVGQIENCLENATGTMPNIDIVAHHLRLSRRTLARRLNEQGTSFRTITEQHLRARAVELLSDESLDISEISGRLGYSEPSNFSRTFRRWFGTSPQEYRDSSTVCKAPSQQKGA